MSMCCKFVYMHIHLLECDPKDAGRWLSHSASCASSQSGNFSNRVCM